VGFGRSCIKMPVEQIWVICAGAAATRLVDVTPRWRTPAGTFARLASDKQVANTAAALERSGQHGGAGCPFIRVMYGAGAGSMRPWSRAGR